MPTASRSGSPGHGQIDRVQRQPARPRVPLGTGRHVPERAVQLPRLARVRAHEQRGRSDARVQDAVGFTRLDDPHPFERDIRDVLGERRALRLLPLAGRIVRVHHARAEETRRHRREVPPGARIPRRELDDVAGERARGDVERRAWLPAKDEQALLRSHEQFGHRMTPSRDRVQHVDVSVGRHLGVLVAALAVHEHVHVTPDRSVLVQHPAFQPRVPALQLPEHLAQGTAGEVDVPVPVGAFLERRAKRHHRHRPAV